MSNLDNTKIFPLLQEVSRRRAEIARLESPDWATDMCFSYCPHGPHIDLHHEDSVQALLAVLGFLQTKEAEYYRAQQTLSLPAQDTPPFSWQGHPFGDWWDDISLKIDCLLFSKKKASLAALEARVNSLLSPELRAQLELDLISKELS